MLSPYAPICEVLFYISCSIHAHIHTLALTSFTPTPPAAASAGSTQRQAKCMLMRARPMVEPHSFWEEMAFNNGGPRGDFAQSSAPLWKMHSIHCCICSLFFSCFFPLRWEEKKKKNSRNIFVSPLPPLASVFMLGGGGLGFWGVVIYLYRNIRNKNTNKWVWIVFKLYRLTFLLPFVALLLFCWDKCPQKHVNCTICISNRWYPVGLGPKNTSKRMNS